MIRRLLSENAIDAVIHFAGSVVVPESARHPLSYYLNNTCKSRSLIACLVDAGVKSFVFSSSAAVYGIPEGNPVDETTSTVPISPYGASKLMTEIMLRDIAAAHDLTYLALRYFNVAGADPHGRIGQSTRGATHLVKAAVQAALGQRPYLEVFGSDYSTPDGTCVRDFIHVKDLTRAHLAALQHLRAGGESQVLNCGYGRGFSVLDVISSVKRVSNYDFAVRQATRRAGDPPTLIAKTDRIREVLGWCPELDDLDTILGHALSWERRLLQYEAVASSDSNAADVAAFGINDRPKGTSRKAGD